MVKCEGEEECAFYISIGTSSSSYHLRDRVKVSKFIKKDEKDFYIISNKNKWGNKLTIVLHSHTGDADLYVSRKFKDPEDDPNRRGRLKAS